MPTLSRYEVDEWFDEPAERFAQVRDAADRAVARAEADERFVAHRRSLGCDSTPAYRQWCRRHGLASHVCKPPVERFRESLISRIDPLREGLGASDCGLVGDVVRQLAGAKETAPPWELSRCLTAFRERLREEMPSVQHDVERMTAFSDLLLELLVRLLRHPDTDTSNVASFVGLWLPAIKHLAIVSSGWRCRPSDIPFETLLCGSCNRIHDERMAESVISRLVSPHELPAWLIGVIRSRDGALMRASLSANDVAAWIRFAATPKARVRSLPFPLPLSRRAIGLLDEVSNSGLEPLMTFRAAQVRAKNGTLPKDRVNAIASSPLGRSVESDAREAFRLDILDWLVTHDDFPVDQIDRAVRYLETQRFEPVLDWDVSGRLNRLIWEPNLSLAGKSTQWLLRRLRNESAAIELASERLPVAGRRLRADRIKLPGNVPNFLMVPLQTQRDFIEEGEAMSNCVASYFDRANAGDASLWSLRLVSREGRGSRLGSLMRRVTLCVDRDAEIEECRGHANRAPHAIEVEAVTAWAKTRNYTLGF